MPIIGKTYAIGNKGTLFIYNHSTNVWTASPVVLPSSNFRVVDVYPYNQDKIVIGGTNTLVYSNDAGITQALSGGDWVTLCPNIQAFSFTDNSNIIYATGVRVVKSVDGGLTFNALPSSPGPVGTASNAIHFTNSLLGIVSFNNQIFKTTDGGVTWTLLYGGAPIDPSFPTEPIFKLHISADGNTILALTKRSAFRSTDGGTSFTNVLTYGSALSPIPDLAFGTGNDNYFIITRNTTSMFRSNNAGASWVTFSGQTPTGSPTFCSLYDLYKGFYTYFITPGTSVAQIYEFQETSPGVFSSTLSYTLAGGVGGPDQVNSIASSFVTAPCYTLTPCTPGGSIITVSNDFSVYADEYVQIDGSCFLVAESLDCVGALPLTYTSIQSIADCTACDAPETSYGLRDCSFQLPSIYTSETLTPGISGYLGDVLYIQGYPNTCWTVIIENGTTQPITILNDYAGCPECIAEVPIPLPPPVYELENCLTQEIIYTLNSQFTQAVDQVVNLVGYPGECWSVAELQFNSQSTISVSIAVNTQGTLAIYENCPCCLPPVPPEPIKYTRVIPKPDRKFYQIQQSQCNITSNIRFADAYYRLFKQLKYGIASQCDNVNLDKLWIKKNLSDLAVINDPTACIITTPVEPIVCLEPKGNPYIPPPPPPVYPFIVGEPGTEGGTFGCTTCLDGNPPAGGIICPSFNVELPYNILDTIEPDSVYVISYNGGCITTLGSFFNPGSNPSYNTYPITESNIVNAGPGASDPCASCIG